MGSSEAFPRNGIGILKSGVFWREDNRRTQGPENPWSKDAKVTHDPECGIQTRATLV